MDQLQHFIRTTRAYAYAIVLTGNLVLIAAWWGSAELLGLEPVLVLAVLLVLAAITPLLIGWVITAIATKPLQLVWQAILYVSPETTSVPAPDLRDIRQARELITNLVNHVYQLADTSQHAQALSASQSTDLNANFIATHLPLPLMVLDETETVLFANNAMLEYLGNSAQDTVGQNVYSVLDLAFVSDNTFDAWLQNAKTSAAVAANSWERVRLKRRSDNTTRLFDLAAYYNKANTNHYETMMVFFDHTEQYSQDEQAISFVALAVHELRTPLTMLRGYIEALEEELQGTLDTELAGFMQKMQASAQQLATFVNNILNVARVEDDQMILKLQEEDWGSTLAATIQDLQLRAQVRGLTISTNIAPNLPKVGIDRVSMYEVVANLVDNAIKYSGASKQIVVSAELTQDGLVQTTVQDGGVGIPESAIPHLFDKFYRDHHNRSQVGGTGLGLYLCKTIIKAHDGNIWVRSKEGQGSIFGFTLQPYARLAQERKNSDNTGITRGAHGWIKNHSLYRG